MMRSGPLVNFYSIIPSGCLLLFTIICPLLVICQSDQPDFKKLSPTLQATAGKHLPEQVSAFVIAVLDNDVFREFAVKKLSVYPDYEYKPANIFVLKLTWIDIIEKILPRREVVFIDQLRTPLEEVAVSNLDISVNKANLIHNRYPLFDGKSITVSIKENRPDTSDIDFKGRYITVPFSSTVLSAHATIMATIAAGAGNTYYEGKGVATGANISSANFANLLPESDAQYQQYNIYVQNHSYGTGIENFYGADAAAYDASAIARPALLHVFSAGNSGTMTSTVGAYSGINGYANITGSFKMAKNIITVGHTDSFSTVLPPSSKGPAYDGRVKPELVAFGEDGSSGAAALVSGIALALQQAYKYEQAVMPSSALVKAILLNSADDAGPRGIDFISGYGAANGFKAMQDLVNHTYYESSVSQGNFHNYDLVVPPNLKQLKITLVWNDAPSTPNSPKALRNDLDMELLFPAGGQTWQPWVLNHFPHIDSLQQIPVRKKDSLNNTEQITVENPVPGNYQVHVNGFSVTSPSSQPFAVAYQFDTLDRFDWHYPSGSDNIFGGRVNTLRWLSSFSAATGQLEYSINNGNSWQLINNAVDLGKGYYKWNAPDTFITAILRMSFTSQNFSSDTFTISKRFNLLTGFNCPDSFLIYWNKVPGVNNYQVYRLGDKYMEPLRMTTDTAIILAKSNNPSLYYAVAPLLNNKTGVRSYGTNYTTQGVTCYVRSFLVTVFNSTVQLNLSLGSVYNISRLILEKFSGNAYIPLQQITNLPGLDIVFTDNQLLQGLNTYRIRIELADGRIIYSQPETVYYFSGNEFIIYPNPVPYSQQANVLSADPSSTAVLQIFNTVGQKIHEMQINDINTPVPSGRFAKGLYFFRFIKEAGPDVIVRVVIQ